MNNELCSNTIAISLHDEKEAPEFCKDEREMMADDILTDMFNELDYVEVLQIIAKDDDQLEAFIDKYEKYGEDYAQISASFHRELIDRALRSDHIANKVQEKLERVYGI